MIAPEPSFFWVAVIYAVAAIAAACGVSAFSIVAHQLVTQGIGPIRWLRPFFYIRVQLHLRRDRRREAEKLPPALRRELTRRDWDAIAAGRVRE